MSYDDWLNKCVEDFSNQETPDEKQERIESHRLQYDEWKDDNKE